jgi:hypothetical protein
MEWNSYYPRLDTLACLWEDATAARGNDAGEDFWSLAIANSCQGCPQTSQSTCIYSVDITELRKVILAGM